MTELERRLLHLRWTGYGLLVTSFILAFFHRNTPAAMADALARDWGAGPAALGALSASYFWVYTVMQIPTGILADRLGPRRIVSLGMAVAGVGTLVFAWAPDVVWGTVGRVLIGLGVAFPFISLMKFSAVWFPERQFATLSGLTVFIGNVGAALAATPLVWLMQQVSWHHAFQWLGLATVLLAGVLWRFLRDRPEQAGLPPVHPPSSAEQVAGEHWAKGLLRVLRNRATWPGFFINFGLAGGAFGFAGLWGIPFLESAYGYTKAEAATQTGLMMVACACGGLTIGRLSDWLGRRKPVMLAWTGVHCLLWLPWTLHWSMSHAMSTALAVGLGFTSAAFALTWAVAKEVNAPSLSGMATGVVNTGAFLGGALIQQLIGVWLQWRLGAGVALADALVESLWLIPVTCAAGVYAASRMTETWARNISDVPALARPN